MTNASCCGFSCIITKEVSLLNIYDTIAAVLNLRSSQDD
jgi:hypothetical protein